MKIYSNVFDLARPVQRQIYVAPNSIYAFGIKIVNTGVPETDFQLKVFQNGVEIQPMDTTVDGFKLFDQNLSLTAGAPYGTTEMVAMHVYEKAFTSRQFGVGQAEALILFVIVACISGIQVYLTKKQEVEA